MSGAIMDGAQNCVGDNCCSCWTEGCGLDGCFGVVADGLETVNPCMERVADAIWIFGSPLAFPIVFCFGDGPETDPPGGGWRVPMILTPIKHPLRCCFYTACAPCGQFALRRKLLDNDMSRYKLWQGYHDGPHCLARRCEGAPITIEAGTYGEERCPNAFLAAEVCFLGCAFSVCCSFDVNRRMIKDQRNLDNDPLENRVNHCVGFFSDLASHLCMCGMCAWCGSCLIGLCAPDSEGAQECSGEGGRAARACFSCAHTCWKGIWSVKIIAMGCASSQMDVEMKEGKPLVRPPRRLNMDRGGDNDGDNDEEKWWLKKGIASNPEYAAPPPPEDEPRPNKKKKKKKKNKSKSGGDGGSGNETGKKKKDTGRRQ